MSTWRRPAKFGGASARAAILLASTWPVAPMRPPSSPANRCCLRAAISARLTSPQRFGGYFFFLKISLSDWTASPGVCACPAGGVRAVRSWKFRLYWRALRT